MFGRLARFLIRQRVRVLVTGGLLFVLAAVLGGNVAQHLSSGGFADPGSESERAERLLEQRFHQGDVNFHGNDQTTWDWYMDPLIYSGEAASFYVPFQADPVVSQTACVGFAIKEIDVLLTHEKVAIKRRIFDRIRAVNSLVTVNGDGDRCG